jgi:hypothetical protein
VPRLGLFEIPTCSLNERMQVGGLFDHLNSTRHIESWHLT